MKSLTLIILFLFSLLVSGHAQKLPNKQEVSVWAPATIKIDGKATEWDDKFQAYNHATNLFHTIANDDSKIYIIVRATDIDVINKLTSRGIKITLSPGNQKKDTISITYPVFGNKHRFHVKLTTFPSLGSAAFATIKSDSMMKVANDTLANNVKWIKVSTVKGTDSLSVYNENGIKGAALFDKQMNFTIELSIDINLLKVPVSSLEKINYHIQLFPVARDDSAWIAPLVFGGSATDQAKIARFFSTIDFSGEYVLAKK